MKHVKLILLALTAILFLEIGIRVFEHNRGNSSKMVTTSPDGATKSIELANIHLGSFDGNENNSVIIQSEINNWKNQGFSIDGLSSQSTYVGAIITTIILSKE